MTLGRTDKLGAIRDNVFKIEAANQETARSQLLSEKRGWVDVWPVNIQTNQSEFTTSGVCGELLCTYRLVPFTLMEIFKNHNPHYATIKREGALT